ncbi:uncharacterized protein LOC114766096 [Denticeps clupeoides]|uniref:uncharacterized protein LOC114766096 n=1 Tax=Denticeps clupeoides TaxID=299321 RepID=UPI0010A2B521|nr:uncharacterized protein LOC114766096 [Denticeps clupeoides]
MITVVLFLFTCIVDMTLANSYFYYKKDGEESPCKGLWQCDTNLDNTVNFNCTEESDECSCSDSNTFVACVNAFCSNHLYPFKPSPCTKDSYIFAQEQTDLTDEQQNPNSLNPSEGNTVSLNCTFHIKDNYKNHQYVVYWIKTENVVSTCVYSYDFNPHDGLHYNHHCNIDAELSKRISNISSEPSAQHNFHHLTINESQLSDSGRYRCVLNVLKKNNDWKVISDITVTVDKRTTTSKPDPVSTSAVPFYVTAALLVLLLLVIISVMILKKKRIKSRDTKNILEQSSRNKNQEETDCSPYAVGWGQETPQSLVQQPNAVIRTNGHNTNMTEPYSVLKFNSIYQSSDH